MWHSTTRCVLGYTLLRNIFAAFINRSNSKTRKLMHAHTINYSGWLHTNEYRQNALGDNVLAQVIMDKKRNLFLQINQMPIAQWFREQFGYLKKRLKGRELDSKPIIFYLGSMYFYFFPTFLIMISQIFIIFAAFFGTKTY